MRLIDADALKAEWYRLNDINEEDCGARFVGYQEIARLINNAPTVKPTGDLISRADAIEVVCDKCPISFKDKCEWKNNGHCSMKVALEALPSAEPKGDLISREEARKAFAKINDLRTLSLGKVGEVLDSVPSADAEFTDLPDIPRYYYEKVVGNMAHEISMLKEQLESAVSREFYEDAVKANIRLVIENGKLKEQIESAEAAQGEWILVKGSNGKDYHKCSKCLHTQEITGVKNYCAVCRARMKGGGE